MQNKKSLARLGLAILLAAGLFIITLVCDSAADDYKIISVISDAPDQGVSLNPGALDVDKGTVVIWLNKSPRNSIDIVFENGKNVCENVVEAQMDFMLDDKKCFITVTHIPPFGTASLMFSKEGAFDYAAQIQGSTTKVKGQIKVK